MSLLFVQQLLNGLLDGAYYLLIALGLSLVFSLGGVVNLAHGAMFAVGAYLTLLLAPFTIDIYAIHFFFFRWHLPGLQVLFAAAVAVGGALAVSILVIRRFSLLTTLLLGGRG